MGCEYIKNLILTDYTDASLNALERKTVQEHKDECSSCRSWAANSKEITMIKHKQPAPETLWNKIEAVLDEKEASHVKGWDFSGILESLRGMFVLRPALGFAVILMLTFTAYTVNTKDPIPMMKQMPATMTVTKDSDEMLLSTDLGTEEESLGSAVEMLFA